MMYFFGCDREEAAELKRQALLCGYSIEINPAEIDESNALEVPLHAVVSVSHKARVTAGILHSLSRRGVRYLNTRSVGTDHIDSLQAGLMGIAAEGVGYSPESIAEHAVMLMLMSLRRAPSVLRRSGQGDYRLPGQRFQTLGSLTVGVVGTGRIGCRVAEILRDFGCRIFGFDPKARNADMEYVSLPELLAQSDIVTLHLPLTEKTHFLMNRKRIAGMKPGAILINTARGGLVDTQALADAVDEGRLSGAGLDVVDGEEGWFYQKAADGSPAPFARLQASENVILTPHCAFYTKAALADIVRNTLDNCARQERMLEKWIV